jgi:hypothetical protein
VINAVLLVCCALPNGVQWNKFSETFVYSGRKLDATAYNKIIEAANKEQSNGTANFIVDDSLLVRLKDLDTLVVFTKSYKPLREYLAKRDLLEILKKNEGVPMRFTSLSPRLMEYLKERFQEVAPGLEIATDSEFSAFSSLHTEIHAPRFGFAFGTSKFRLKHTNGFFNSGPLDEETEKLHQRLSDYGLVPKKDKDQSVVDSGLVPSYFTYRFVRRKAADSVLTREAQAFLEFRNWLVVESRKLNEEMKTVYGTTDRYRKELQNATAKNIDEVKKIDPDLYESILQLAQGQFGIDKLTAEQGREVLDSCLVTTSVIVHVHAKRRGSYEDISINVGDI